MPTDLLSKCAETYRTKGPLQLCIKTLKYLVYKFEPGLTFCPVIPTIEFAARGQRLVIGGRSKGYTTAELPVKSSDLVVEVGAYHGVDTATFGKLARRVVAFEPSQRNFSTASENLKNMDNVEIINKGVWNSEDELKVNYGNNPGDDGFLEPDSGRAAGDGEVVDVNTLENLMQNLCPKEQTIDYLKIEAEGAEQEVIEGLGDLTPRNIVVNIDDERAGFTPGEGVFNKLIHRGYTPYVVRRGQMAFFTLEEVPHKGFSKTVTNVIT